MRWEFFQHTLTVMNRIHRVCMRNAELDKMNVEVKKYIFYTITACFAR